MSNQKRIYIITATIIGMILIGYFLLPGIAVTGDSEQYISMHIHREPLYPIFLLILREIFSEEYLTVTGILQCALLAFSISGLTLTIKEEFSLSRWEILAVSLIQLFPFILTTVISKTHVFIPGSIMSEALCFPLFYFFLSNLIKLLFHEERMYLATSFIFVLLLSLTRGQMQALILVWGIAAFCRIYSIKGKRLFMSLVVSVLLVCLCFISRGVIVKSYNRAFNGSFINNTYGDVTLLSNVLYVCDREAGEKIEDNKDKEFFYEMFDKAYDQGGNYSYYQDENLKDQAYALEKWHDIIKFYCIEDTYYQYYDNNITTDYVSQNLMADESAMRIIKAVFPTCVGRWIKNYLLLSYLGLSRTVLVDNSLLSLAAVLEYLVSIVVIAVLFKKKTYGRELLLLSLSILINFAICFSTAMLIMCLSRYMIYGFALFYISWFLIIKKCLWKQK